MADEKKVVLLEIDINTDAAIEAQKQLIVEVAALEKETKDLLKTEGDLSTAYIKKAAELKNAKGDLAANEKAIQKIAAANNTEIGTIKRLKAENSALVTERENLNLATKEGADRLVEINAKLDENGQTLKDSSDKFTNAKVNIGNYEESIKNALGSMDKFSVGGVGLGSVIGGLSEQTGGVKGLWSTMVSGIGSATKAGIAFILTPIGAVIAAIVAGIALFTTAISANDEAGEGLGKIWAGVSEVIDVLVGRVVKVAKALFALATGDFAGAVDNMSQAFGGLAAEMENAYKAGMRIKQMQIEMESVRVKSITTLTELKILEDKLAIIAEDSTLSTKQRMEATYELMNAQVEAANVVMDLARRENNIEAEKFILARKNGTNLKEARLAYIEANNKYKETEAAVTLTVMENAKKRREIGQELLDTNLKYLIDNFDSIKTANEKIINSEETVIKARQNGLDDLRAMSNKSFSDQISAIERYAGKRVDVNKLLEIQDSQQLANQIKLLNVSTFVSDKLLEMIREKRLAEADFNESQTAIRKSKATQAVAQMDFELAMYKVQNQSKTDESKRYTEEVFNSEKQRLLDLNNKELAINEQKFANNLIKENEYLLAKETLTVDNLTAITDLTKNWEETERARKIEAAQADYDNQLVLLEGNVFGQLELQSQKLAAQTEQELLAADKTGADKALILEKWAKTEEQIEKAKTDAKLSLAAGFAGNLKTIAGEGTSIGKAAAVAETTINTYKAATGAYASLASIPYIGPALGAAAAAAAVVAGLANVKKIISIKNPNGGDGGAGSAGTGGGATTSVPRSSVNPEIGKGLVSRSISTGTQSSVASGVQLGMNGVTVQPTLVIDTVTAKQNQATNNAQTATY